jgi:hypothetical protein
VGNGKVIQAIRQKVADQYLHAKTINSKLVRLRPTLVVQGVFGLPQSGAGVQRGDGLTGLHCELQVDPALCYKLILHDMQITFGGQDFGSQFLSNGHMI